jgi:hypothetical protein
MVMAAMTKIQRKGNCFALVGKAFLSMAHRWLPPTSDALSKANSTEKALHMNIGEKKLRALWDELGVAPARQEAILSALSVRPLRELNDTYGVAYRPEQANPPSHPYVVLKNGKPLMWWVTFEAARSYAQARVNGLSHEEAIHAVKRRPDADVPQDVLH